MALSFEFATAQQIVFGAGKAQTIPQLAKALGTRALIIHGRANTGAHELIAGWQNDGFAADGHSIHGEPTVEDAMNITAAARQARCDMIIAIGGGSVIDTGKAVAALLTNPGDPLDYLEVVGRGQPLRIPSAPLIAAPTTAGTGAEVTRNAVLAVPEKAVKVSLRSATMLPRIALIDPELTYSMPPAITASTGMDALTQCIEPFVSNQANPLTDALAAEGFQAAARSLRKAFHNGSDADARADMCVASLCGGIALANAKLGAVHGFAGVLGGMFPIPHGVVCARLLPSVMHANVNALDERAPHSHYRARLDKVAQWLTGDATASAREGVNWLQNLCDELQIPPLRDYGITSEHFDEIVAKSKQASSMKGNPIQLSDRELHHILTAAL
jgi:alcohol dehydrogenase class IV